MVLFGIFQGFFYVFDENRSLKGPFFMIKTTVLSEKCVIALLCSVPAETELLLRQTVAPKITPLGSKEIIEGTIANKDVRLCVGGMGKVNAAHAATLLLTRYDPEALIIFGVGGAYPASGAQIGDVVLAKEEIAGDEGVLTLNGFKDAEYIGI